MIEVEYWAQVVDHIQYFFCLWCQLVKIQLSGLGVWQLLTQVLLFYVYVHDGNTHIQDLHIVLANLMSWTKLDHWWTPALALKVEILTWESSKPSFEQV